MSHPSSVPLLPAREGEVLRRHDAMLPVDFPGSDAAFAAGAAVGPCNTPTFLSSNHRDGMDSVGGNTDIATGPEVLRRCSSTLTVDFPEAGPVVCLTNTSQEGDRLLFEDIDAAATFLEMRLQVYISLFGGLCISARESGPDTREKRSIGPDLRELKTTQTAWHQKHKLTCAERVEKYFVPDLEDIKVSNSHDIKNTDLPGW
ncbi:hypothetical protein B0H17DRAFT_1134041 [Mycena rosella]|uniref:Uncharacterized protein n=1 Tax=Mycena rosella TaxID=1033263 RepID=A0AAD7DH01_MYCRO|nr:hypothetical protein B0H17DRAFT_1134041 [Mycena rosella]